MHGTQTNKTGTRSEGTVVSPDQQWEILLVSITKLTEDESFVPAALLVQSRALEAVYVTLSQLS